MPDYTQIPNTIASLTLTQVARACISGTMFAGKIGDIIKPESIIPYSYLKYPYTEEEILKEIYSLIDNFTADGKTLQLTGTEYLMVSTKKVRV